MKVENFYNPTDLKISKIKPRHLIEFKSMGTVADFSPISDRTEDVKIE